MAAEPTAPSLQPPPETPKPPSSEMVPPPAAAVPQAEAGSAESSPSGPAAELSSDEVEMVVPPGAAVPAVSSDPGRSPSLPVEEKLARAHRRLEDESMFQRNLLQQQLNGHMRTQYSMEFTVAHTQEQFDRAWKSVSEHINIAHLTA